MQKKDDTIFYHLISVYQLFSSNIVSMKIYAEAVPGIPIFEPEEIPLPGEVVVGYRIIESNDKFLVKPKPSKMNTTGWVSVVVCAICCWPVSCVPCCLGCSYSRYQVPVYGPSPFTFSHVTVSPEVDGSPTVTVQKSKLDQIEKEETPNAEEDQEAEPSEVKINDLDHTENKN